MQNFFAILTDEFKCVKVGCVINASIISVPSRRKQFLWNRKSMVVMTCSVSGDSLKYLERSGYDFLSIPLQCISLPQRIVYYSGVILRNYLFKRCKQFSLANPNI